MSDKVPLDPGGCYLLTEERPEVSYRLFSTLAGMKKAGMVITRQYPGHVRRDRGLGDVRIVWLGHTRGEDFSGPTALGNLAEVIQTFIDDHEGTAAILVDGLEYLMVNNGFARTLAFIKQVTEFATRGRAIVLLPVSPETLADAELAALKRIVKVFESPSSRTAVRLIPKRAGLVQECHDLRSLLPANSDVDDGVRPLEEKIRSAQRSLIPFIVLVSGGETRAGILHVLHYQGREQWMSLGSLLRAVKDWEAVGG